MLSQVPTEDACLSCGACCAFFRVSFYWAEGISMPEHYTEPVTAVYSCMAGTNQASPRCIALQGTIGGKLVVGCMNSVALHVKKFKSLMINATKHDVRTI